MSRGENVLLIILVSQTTVCLDAGVVRSDYTLIPVQ